MTLLIVIAVVLLLFSALLSAAETAVFAPSDSSVRTLEEEGFQGAQSLREARGETYDVHLTLRLLDSLLNLGATGLLVYAGVTLEGVPGLAAAVVGAILTVLLVGEIIPRALARRRPVRLALGTAPILLALSKALRPVVAPLSHLDRAISATDSRDQDPDRTEEGRVLEEIADLGAEEGVVPEEERQLVERAFRLDELSAWEIMTPRVDVFAWPDSLSLEEIVPELSSVPFSRVPVYGETVDDITGILSVREALERYVSGHGSTRLKEIAREPIFIPGSLSLTRCLRLFQIRRSHMGVVADEFGGTDGIVTLEDVVEELVGEIEDETDLPEVSLVQVSAHEAVCDGSADLRDLNKLLDLELPLEEHRSLNGLILEEAGRVPAAGEVLDLEGVRVEIMEASDTQVLRARLTRVDAPIEQEDS